VNDAPLLMPQVTELELEQPEPHEKSQRIADTW